MERSSQLLIVTTKAWDSIRGEACFFERSHGVWTSAGERFAVVVGRNGLAWDANVPRELRSSGIVLKEEGDGKAPAGAFKILGSFGYAAQALAGAKMPYMVVSDGIECVDDPLSAYYNRIVDRRLVEKVDWVSSERMDREDGLYEWGAFVGYNSDPVLPGAGSAIFLHLWKGEGEATAGCTAMKKVHLEKLLRYLDPQKDPMIVQLPEREYDRWQRLLDLPSIA